MSAHRTTHLWRTVETDRAEVAALAGELDVPHVIAHLLVSRGLSSVEACRNFLAPEASHLSDPFALQDMDSAVERIAQAKARDEQVLVFGDYDVDGITGAALLYRALQRFGVRHCRYGMPSRLVEGYGLSADQVARAKEEGVGLIITVDNGISAFEAAEEAQRLGIDLVITDHHEIERGLPPAHAVINPKRDGCAGPMAAIAGSGVAFKLAQALTGDMPDLDLVALGTVADVVPLVGENRVLTALGIAQMKRAPRPGIRALARVARLNLDELTAGDIAFQLAPRINAGGRLGDGMAGLALLLAESERDAVALAEELDAANEERRLIEREIADEALAMLERSFDDAQRSVVLAKRGWHPGVVGIVASKLQRHYYRPVVLIAVDESGEGRGSARSIEGFDIAAALAACGGHLDKYGGHRAAGGLTLRADRIETFHDAFEAVARQQLAEAPVRSLKLDAQVALSQVDARLVRLLGQLEPFGEGHRAPVFCSYGVEPMPGSIRPLRGGHVKASFRQGARALPAIAFSMEDRLHPGLDGQPLDIAFTPTFNTWRGETTVQLQIKDVRPSAG